MCSPDYYKILGIDRKATAKEIKTAYYDLAKKHHPDTKPGYKIYLQVLSILTLSHTAAVTSRRPRSLPKSPRPMRC